MEINFFSAVFFKLRLVDSFRYKIPVLISIPYLFLEINEYEPLRALLLILAAVITCFGFVGFGYATNDLGDIETDRIIGKSNFMGLLTSFQTLGLILFFLVAALLPWLYLPFNKFSLLFIVTELLSFIFYAFPPLRLKERGFGGIFTDALYAHVIPVTFAAFTFNLSGKSKISSLEITCLFVAVFLWQLALGIRNILLHQIADFENDQRASAKTFVVKIGEKRAKLLLIYFYLPAEILLFAGLVVIITWITGLFFLYALTVLLGLLTYMSMRQLRSGNYRVICNSLIDDFYIECFPIAALMLLCHLDLRFIALLLLHIFIFRNNIFAHLQRYFLPKGLKAVFLK
jgi:4-hydroxybenzoate polyprenyltransferase